MKKSQFCLALVLVATVALPSCSSGGSPSARPDSASADAKSGAVGLDLTIGGGVVLSTVHYHVVGNGITPVDGDIAVDASGATASLLLRLPAGTGYSATFSSTDTSGHTTCTGTATFDVTAGVTNGVTVPLTCGTATKRGNRTFNGTFNTCPDISQLAVAPLLTGVGGKINVSADATDVDTTNTLTFAWTATGGSFDSPGSKSTKYNCSGCCTQTLTLSVSDGQGCVTTVTADVHCESDVFSCGNGRLEPGETCDPPTPGSCAPTCQIITPHCGDGFVQTGETCEPPNTASCDATCHGIACGDGVVSGTETCEPPNTATCDALCHVRIDGTPVCGDGVVEPPEECDPPTPDNACTPQCRINPCEACTTQSCADLAAGCAATSGGPSGCDTVLACITATGCAKGSTREGAECYCGANVDNSTCFGFNANAPQGACKAVIDAAIPGGPLAVGSAFFDTTTGLGSAMQETSCRANFCPSQCNLCPSQCTSCPSRCNLL